MRDCQADRRRAGLPASFRGLSKNCPYAWAAPTPQMRVVSSSPRTLAAVIFDVDGVLLASPHEEAWRDALLGIAGPERLTTAMYQTHVAGKPRLSGARAVLEQLGVSDAGRLADTYAERKQRRLEELIERGEFAAFPDALRFVEAVERLGFRLAAASSSKNANAMMRMIRFGSERSLLEVFAVNVCGRDLRQGKPHPELFLIAAGELGIAPASCLVVEDASAGILAARAGGMMALGIARLNDETLLRQAGADLVVTSLDDVAVEGLAEGRVRARPN
jgi:beta-phosphoglucomutase-like phosphatase (HAD superfamily)